MFAELSINEAISPLDTEVSLRQFMDQRQRHWIPGWEAPAPNHPFAAAPLLLAANSVVLLRHGWICVLPANHLDLRPFMFYVRAHLPQLPLRFDEGTQGSNYWASRFAVLLLLDDQR